MAKCLFSLFLGVLLTFCRIISAQDAPLVSPNTITIDVNGLEIRELLKIYSLKSGYTVVSTKQVQGRVSVFINGLDYDKALEVIAVSAGGAYEKKGNLIKFMTQDEYKALYGHDFDERRVTKEHVCRHASALSIKKILDQFVSAQGNIIVDQHSSTVIMFDTPEKIQQMSRILTVIDVPAESEVFSLNYARSQELRDKLSQYVSSDNIMISDERTNTLLISGNKSEIDSVRRIANIFDAPEKQVEIQSTIVKVTLTDGAATGIDWSMICRGVDDLTIANSFAGPSSGDFASLSAGSLTENNYNAVLSMLKTQGDVKLHSNPRIVVLNNETARLHVGAKEPIVTARNDTELDSNNIVKTDQIEFVDVGVNLYVVPEITNDGYVRMKIKPEINSIRETLTTDAGSLVPVVETSLVDTVVNVKDESILMVSGLIKDESSDQRSRLPGKEIPFLNALLGKHTGSHTRVEYVVFIKPRIINRGETYDKAV